MRKKPRVGIEKRSEVGPSVPGNPKVLGKEPSPVIPVLAQLNDDDDTDNKSVETKKTGPELALERINSEIVGVAEITSREQYLDFGKLLAECDIEKKKRHAYFEGMRLKTCEAHREAVKMQSDACKPFDNVIGIIKNRRNKFWIAAETKRDEDEAAARKKSDAAAKKIQDDIDKEREKLKVKKTAAPSPKAFAKIEQKEAALDDKELEVKTEAYIPVIENSLNDKSDGFSKSKDFEIVIVNVLDFIKEVGRKKIPLKCVKILLPDVKKWVKAADIDMKEFSCFTKKPTVRERKVKT